MARSRQRFLEEIAESAARIAGKACFLYPHGNVQARVTLAVRPRAGSRLTAK
jgi:hypothetical protein